MALYNHPNFYAEVVCDNVNNQTVFIDIPIGHSRKLHEKNFLMAVFPNLPL